MRPLALMAVLLVAQLTSTAPSPECIGCRADFTQIRSAYSEEDWRVLTRGDVVTSKSDGARSAGAVQSDIESSAVIPYSAAQVWGVVTDFESRPNYLPGAKEVRIVRAAENQVWLAEHLRVLLMNIRYGVICTLDREMGTVTWVLDESVPHDIAGTRGSWQVVPLPEGQRTLMRYRAWIDTGRPLPHFIEEFLVQRSLPKLIEGLRSEVHRRFRP